MRRKMGGSEMAFCPLCGKQLPANGICSCGQKLDENGNVVQAADLAVQPIPQAVPQQQAPQQPMQPGYAPQQNQYGNPAPQQQGYAPQQNQYVNPGPQPQPQPQPRPVQPAFTPQQLAEMNKTKLGISAAAFVAITYLVAYFSGYLALIAAVGLVLVFEKENEWIKKNVLKALVLLVCFSICNAALYLIPDLLEIIGDSAAIANVSLYFISKTRQVFNVLNDILVLFKEVLFLLLALFALKNKTIKIGFIDKFIDKALAAGK